MKLLYTLKESQQQALALQDGETIWYCVPVDLAFDNGARSPRPAIRTRPGSLSPRIA